MSDTNVHRMRLWRDIEWRAVVAAFMLNGLLFGAWAARVPAFKDRFDLDPGALGLLLLALAAGAIASFPFAGAFTERLGASKLTILCALFYAPALALIGMAPTFLTLGLALGLFGAIHGAMDVAMNGWGAQVETRTKRSTMSIFHAMFSLGAGLGAASGFVAVRWGLEPELHFAAVALIGGVGGLGAMIGTGSSQSGSPTNHPETPLVALPSGPLVLVGLVAFSASMGEGAMADWSAVFLRFATNASEAQSALGYTVFSISMVLTRLSGGIMVERFGPAVVVRASSATALVGLLIAIISQEISFVLVGFALTGVGYAVVMPLVFARAARDPDVPAGPAIASVAMLGYGGLLLGPPVIGFIAQMTNMRLSFLVLAGLAVLAMILASKLTEPH
ncbi:MAG: MFS transporter [Sulfitobacter sp.]